MLTYTRNTQPNPVRPMSNIPDLYRTPHNAPKRPYASSRSYPGRSKSTHTTLPSQAERGWRGDSQTVVCEGDVPPLRTRLRLVHGRHPSRSVLLCSGSPSRDVRGVVCECERRVLSYRSSVRGESINSGCARFSNWGGKRRRRGPGRGRDGRSHRLRISLSTTRPAIDHVYH